MTKTSRAFAKASAAGIGVPLVPTEGRDEPRKTAKYGKPTQMAQDVLYCNKFECIQKCRKKEKEKIGYLSSDQYFAIMTCILESMVFVKVWAFSTGVRAEAWDAFIKSSSVLANMA